MEFDEDGNEVDPDLLIGTLLYWCAPLTAAQLCFAEMPAASSALEGMDDHNGSSDPFSPETQINGLHLASGLSTACGHDMLDGGEAMDALDPSRRTLAFELASLESTEHNNDLLAELGIDQPHLDDAGHDSIDQVHNDASTHVGDPSLSDQPYRTASQTPLRKAKSRASCASLQHSPDARTAIQHKHSHSFSAVYGMTKEETEDALETALLSDQTKDCLALDEAISCVSSFTARLQESNDVGAYKQTSIEQLATSLVKDMYKAAKRREDHLHEVQDVQKLLDSLDPTWQAVFANMDPMSVNDFDSSGDNLLKIRKSRLAILVEGEVGTQSSKDSSAAMLYGTSPPQVELVELRLLTESLITSLGALSEQMQIAKAANHDVSRRVKSLESGVARMKGESEALERSFAHIAAFEAQEEKLASTSAHLRQTALPGLADSRRRKVSSNSTRSQSSNGSLGGSFGRYSQQIRGELRTTAKMLESAHERARLLLSV